LMLLVGVKMDKCLLCEETKTVLLLWGGMVLCRDCVKDLADILEVCREPKSFDQIEEELVRARKWGSKPLSPGRPYG